MDKYYYQFFTDFIKQHRPQVIAEIGVASGKLTRKVLRSECKEFIREYWAIDIWAPSPDWTKFSVEKWQTIYESFCKYYPWFPMLKIFRIDSVKAASYFWKDYFDLVFIDACHLYECVQNDIQKWYPLVKVGGWITGHDYGVKQHHGVQKAVDEFFGQDNIQVHHEIWTHQKV